MIHDWLKSGEILHPWEFAQRNYSQYPAFHLPYHPPVYPGLLALFFSVTGVSYAAGRYFIALCLGAAACFLFAILRRTGTGLPAAFCGALLFVTLPEVAYWSRDTMSEIPAMALILAGTSLFLKWLETGNRWTYVAAFAVAEAAFLSRHLTAGIVPAWLLFAILSGKARKYRSWVGVAAPAAYLAISSGWVIFSRQYSIHENGVGGVGPNRNYADVFSWEIARFYLTQLPTMLGWPVLILSLVGMIYGWYGKRTRISSWLWVCWFLSNFGLVEAVGIYDESRYFIFALPAFAAWIAMLLDGPQDWVFSRYLAATLVAACLVVNLFRIQDFSKGVVGHEAIGRQLSALQEPGNILISSSQQAQLIFAYRSHPSAVRRSFVRADRTLVIRPPAYTDAPTTVLAHNTEDVLRLMERGRIRYVVSTTTEDAGAQVPSETRLLKEVLGSNPESFARLGEFAIEHRDRDLVWRERLELWKLRGALPEGPSELPVVIPTAGLSIDPAR